MVRRDWIDQAEDPAAVMQNQVVDFAPLKCIGQPEEIAQAILYLASVQAGSLRARR